MDESLDGKVENMRYYLQHEHDYKQCIIECEKLFNQLKENDEQFYFWACMHDEALCYRKLNDIDKSIKYANRAMLYNVEKDQYIKSVWLIADNFVSKGTPEKAVPFYLECVRYYRKSNLKRLRISILFNIAKTRNKPLTMIKLLKAMMFDENFTYKNMLQSDVGKYNLLLSGYREFIEYCLEHNCKEYIFILLNSIKDKQIKSEAKKIINELRCI